MQTHAIRRLSFLHERGRKDEATDMYRLLLEAAEEAEDLNDQLEALARLGHAAVKSGSYNEAVALPVLCALVPLMSAKNSGTRRARRRR